jgi:DNA polymerase (family 10)
LEVAAIFDEIADLLELQGANPFRIRAFRRAAQTIANLPENVVTMLTAGSLNRVPGIGEGMISRIHEIIDRGDTTEHIELRNSLPPGLIEMMQIEGLGPKKIRLIYDELGIRSIDELEVAAMQGYLANLPRMGERTQANILKAIESYRRRSTGRISLGNALPQGLAIRDALRQSAAVGQVELGGSCRRMQETIGDLDLLVASKTPTAVMDYFAALPQVREVMLRGDTKCSVRLNTGLQVDLRVVAPESFGAALHYFTGSKNHNIAIRDRGKRQGLKINEYGIFQENTQTLIGGKNEDDVFHAVGLPFIPPELREGSGEIEAAEAGTLPVLITAEDLQGDLHAHTNASDGQATAEEMAQAAIKLGYQYLAITDHSRSLTVAHGLNESRLAEQSHQLRDLEQKLGQLRILRGIEVDILVDGRLDLPLEVLGELDWVVASVHSHLKLSATQMTERIIKAMESGVVDCIGHPSGRLLGQREPYAVDLDQIIQAAQRLGVAMELNCHPDRLDLDAPHCRQAKSFGVLVAINTDSHTPWQLTMREFGIGTARRGWLETKDVLNAGPVSAIEERRHNRLRQLSHQVPASYPSDKKKTEAPPQEQAQQHEKPLKLTPHKRDKKPVKSKRV